MSHRRILRVPYRTDVANPHLEWYRPKPGEFPPFGSEHVVDGVLMEADFIHRWGQFRRNDDGTVVDFSLPPFGTILYLNAEADLRDLPLGTLLHFATYQDENGEFTRVATIRDDFTTLRETVSTCGSTRSRRVSASWS